MAIRPSDNSSRFGAARDQRGHILSYDTHGNLIPNGDDGRPKLAKGQTVFGTTPPSKEQVEASTRQEAFWSKAKANTSGAQAQAGGQDSATPKFSPPKDSLGNPLVRGTGNGTVIAREQPSWTERNINTPLGQRTPQDGYAKSINVPGKTVIGPGGKPQTIGPTVANARFVVPSEKVASTGRIVDETGDRTAQFAMKPGANQSDSPQQVAQVYGGGQNTPSYIRGGMDTRITAEQRAALQKSNPDIFKAGTAANKQFVEAWNAGGHNNDAVALAGKLFPQQTGVASNAPSAPATPAPQTTQPTFQTAAAAQPEVKPVTWNPPTLDMPKDFDAPRPAMAPVKLETVPANEQARVARFKEFDQKYPGQLSAITPYASKGTNPENVPQGIRPAYREFQSKTNAPHVIDDTIKPKLQEWAGKFSNFSKGTAAEGSVLDQAAQKFSQPKEVTMPVTDWSKVAQNAPQFKAPDADLPKQTVALNTGASQPQGDLAKMASVNLPAAPSTPKPEDDEDKKKMIFAGR